MTLAFDLKHWSRDWTAACGMEHLQRTRGVAVLLPAHWQTAAVLFGCVPPKGASFPVGVDPVTREERHVTVEFDDEFVLLYDELYILQCNALMYGERMKGK